MLEEKQSESKSIGVFAVGRIVCLISPRAADEQAALQRRREEEAEARRAAAKKASTTRIPERPAATSAAASSRADSSDTPPGPPRLNLAGSKPTWRERQTQKAAEGAPTPQAAPAAPPSEIATSETQLPKKTGYLPPALRGEGATRGRPDAQPSPAVRDESSGGEAPAKWRPSARRDDVGRDGSASRFAELRRNAPSGRDQSPADGVKPDGSSEGGLAKAAPGKYVPIHMRNRG